MKNGKTIIIVIIALLALVSCGKNTVLNPDANDPTAINFGTSNTLDVVTWNLRTFPEGTDLTTLKEMISALNAEVIAFQEIMDYNAFMDLAEEIPYYDACVYSLS